MSQPPENPEPYGGIPGAPYGRQPYGADHYGQPGYGQYGQYQPYAQDPYADPAHGPGAQRYGMPAFGAQGYGAQQFGVQPYEPPQFGMQPYAQAARKEPALSLLASFFLPGLGSMINGEGGKGAGIMILWMFGLLLSVVLIGVPIAFGAWVWGMVDGYSGAQRHNARHGLS